MSRSERFKKIIQSTDLGPRFVLPSVFFGPVFQMSSSDPRLIRAIYGAIWLSSETMKQGRVARFRVPAFDAKLAFGLDGYRSVGEGSDLDEIIKALRLDKVLLPDGQWRDLFPDICLVDEARGRMVEWQFLPEFSEQFIEPKRYAVLDIEKTASIKSALDMYLYVRVSSVKRMKKRVFEASWDEVRIAAGFAGRTVEARRLRERLSRSLKRVCMLAGVSAVVHPLRTRGLKGTEGYRVVVVPRDETVS